MIYCSHCGAKNAEEALFCASCGKELIENLKSEQQPPSKAQTYPVQGERKLTRCVNNKVLGGVCAGFAKYSNMDVDLARLLFILGFLFSGSLVFIAYVILWIILPEGEC
ncbi:MAG: PspC domain-containing protein [Candidatus Heimdallarchaeaceae archaeon]